MIRFITKSGYNNQEAKLGSRFVYPAPEHVIEVQADGEELRAVLAQVYYLVQTKSDNQRWFGDHAKFIAANLKL